MRKLRCNPEKDMDIGFVVKKLKRTLLQHRVTKPSPKEAAEQNLHKLFEDAMTYW